MQVFIGYPLFKKFIGKEQDNQDDKEGGGFRKGNTSEEIDHIGTRKPPEEKLDGQWKIFFIPPQYCIFPPAVVYPVVQVKGYGKQCHMQAQHDQIVEPVNPSQGKRIKYKPACKKYKRGIFFMPPDEFSQAAVPGAYHASFH
jgi:hypothetical protein